MLRTILPALALGFTTIFATPVSAATVVTTFSGTVTNNLNGNGIDVLGLFGNAYADLTGKAFTVTYVVDDTAIASSYISAQQSTYAGGQYYGPSKLSPLTATLKINGHTYQFPTAQNQYYSYVTLENAAVGVEDAITYSLQGLSNSSGYSTSELFTRVTSTVNDFTSSTDIHASLDRVVTTGDLTDGFANIGAYGNPRDVLGLAITRVTVMQQATVPVPEPATWAMMIAGFGLVGGAMRRRGRLALA